MTVKEFLTQHLTLAVEMVQSGEIGEPTLDDLKLCGKIHALIEENT